MLSAKHYNCTRCGKFMRKEYEDDSPLEAEFVQWWICPKCGLNIPEHLYFKSTIKSDSLRMEQK